MTSDPILHERLPSFGRLSTISTREEIGDWLNANGMTGQAAEIGVMHGGFSKTVLARWRGKKYIMVDPWELQPKEIYKEKTDDVPYESKFQDCQAIAAANPIVSIMRDYSTSAARKIEDRSLDWVYIDANHSYKAVLEDMDAWFPKLKIGGLFSGHDYENNITPPHWCEVKSAVDRWMGERNMSFIVTSCMSWWTIKLQ